MHNLKKNLKRTAGPPTFPLGLLFLSQNPWLSLHPLSERPKESRLTVAPAGLLPCLQLPDIHEFREKIILLTPPPHRKEVKGENEKSR
jgi:hypothetical protein